MLIQKIVENICWLNFLFVQFLYAASQQLVADEYRLTFIGPIKFCLSVLP